MLFFPISLFVWVGDILVGVGWGVGGGGGRVGGEQGLYVHNIVEKCPVLLALSLLLFHIKSETVETNQLCRKWKSVCEV